LAKTIDMLNIGDVLVSEDVQSEHFACNLSACKGACCWEGEYGAPLSPEELPILATIYPEIAAELTPAGREAIEAQGVFTTSTDQAGPATPLIDGGACAHLVRDEAGVALCGIERAYRAGKIDWPKPISCHLYPIRVRKAAGAVFARLEYDRWDICSAACTKGKKEKVRIFEFAKTALIRKYGEAWYDELVAAVNYQSDKSE